MLKGPIKTALESRRERFQAEAGVASVRVNMSKSRPTSTATR
jgi:hypothetical protein